MFFNESHTQQAPKDDIGEIKGHLFRIWTGGQIESLYTYINRFFLLDFAYFEQLIFNLTALMAIFITEYIWSKW